MLCSSTFPHLGFGEFFGSRDRRVEFNGAVVSLMRPDPDLEVELHTHETAHLILTLSGSYLSSAAHAPRVCPFPALIYNPPGTTHRDRYHRGDGVIRGRFLSVGIGSDTWSLMAEASPSGDAELRSDVRTLSLGARLLQATMADDAVSLDVEALIYELVGSFSSTSRRRTVSRAMPSWLPRALELLRERCAERISIGDVAIACGVHHVYLARAFRRHVGRTPGDVVREARLERAAMLLATTRSPLSEVAADSGFSDQSHLTTAFRRATLLTPGNYRALLRISSR